MKRFFALILALCLILCGCGQQAEEETTAATTQATAAATEAPTTETTEAPTETTEAPTEPEELTDPLNGTTVEQAVTARPYAIMINNAKPAMPHCGTGEADVIYETLVEGSITRMMAIFSDPADAGAIGPVRSARPYFISIMQGYDTIYSSAGGSDEAISILSDLGWDYLNGIASNNHFYRDQVRMQYVDYEHTLFITGEGLIGYAQDENARTTKQEGQQYGLNFDEEAAFDGETANTVSLRFQDGGKSTVCNYNSELNAYTLYQHGQDYIDGNTGEMVPFRNVLILRAQTYLRENGIHVYVETVGEGTGYYARDGKLIPINWSKASDEAPYVYTTADGQPLNLGVGKTYIAIIDDEAPVSYE